MTTLLSLILLLTPTAFVTAGISPHGSSASPLGTFNPRVPVVCKKGPFSSTSTTSSCEIPSLPSSATALQLSGGGFVSYVDESDIIIEIRGGSTTNTLLTPEGNISATATTTSTVAEGAATPGASVTATDAALSTTATGTSDVSSTIGAIEQPLRISTYRRGLRQMKNSERREKRRLKRLERMEKRKLKREAKHSHKVYAKKLKNRNNLNIKRKVLHASFGLFFATVNQVLPRKIFVPGMTFFTTFTLTVELLRYRKGFSWMNDLMHFILGGTLRKQEMDGSFTGGFYYFLGVTLTSFLFPKSCASLGICQLALADPSASFFGRQTRHVYWSRIENGLFGIGRNKGILGFLGGAAFCFPFNYYVLNQAKYGGSTLIPGGQSSVALASIALGLAGAFADLCVPTPALTMPKKIMGIPMPRFHVDDNFVVPILSGYACTKVFDKLGWNNGVDLAKFLVF